MSLSIHQQYEGHFLKSGLKGCVAVRKPLFRKQKKDEKTKICTRSQKLDDGTMVKDALDGQVKVSVVLI